MAKKCTLRIPYFTKALLAEANEIAIRRGYNRACDPGFIKLLPETLTMPIVSSMTHQHRHGEPCPPHKRVLFMFHPDCPSGAIDCDMDLYKCLPLFPHESP